MYPRLLFLFLFTPAIIFSQQTIALVNGELLINQIPITVKTNKLLLDEAMHSKSVYRFITSSYDPNNRTVDPTNFYQALYKESALAFRLSAPKQEIEEIVIRMNMEPLFDLPKRLQKRAYALYQGEIKIGNVLLNRQVTTENVDTVFDSKDILSKEVKCIGNHPVPYMLVRHQDWLVELVFCITSNQLKTVVLKH